MSAKKSKPNDKEQSARFIEKAEQIEQKENPQEAFEDALGKIVKTKRFISKD